MARKSSAFYQRLFRQRMRDKGWVKKEVWINPDAASVLTSVEELLRGGQEHIDQLENNLSDRRGMAMAGTLDKQWTTPMLGSALLETELVSDGRIVVDIIEGLDPTILIEMQEFGQLPLFMVACGQQIVVAAILWPMDEVKDVNAFNQEVLRTHKLFPLSTISLDRYPDGEDYYTMFGALSAFSALKHVEIEILTLAENVLSATMAYAPYLKTPISAEAEL